MESTTKSPSVSSKMIYFGTAPMLVGTRADTIIIDDIMMPATSRQENKMSIGGETCHLCGANRKTSYSSVFTRYGKKYGTPKDDIVKVTTYTCGTSVRIESKTGKPEKRNVVVGKNCIREVADDTF